MPPMTDRLRALLTEPAVRDLDPDSATFTAAHREVLRKKALLRRLFEGFYRSCRGLDRRHFGTSPGARIEIGSGSSFFKEIYPDVVTSDIKPLPFVDLVARAEHLPFQTDSVRAIYGINVFHHLPNPRAFLREVLRVLHPGGGVVLIEPYYGPFARFLFKRLHATERFDMQVPGWEDGGIGGPLSNANQALSYIVFARDREILRREFPQLDVVVDRPHTHVLYLLSGGVNFRQLVPAWCGAALVCAERVLTPLNHLLAIQHTIVLRKRMPAA
jgi:SAM-dependent methyltransferase